MWQGWTVIAAALLLGACAHSTPQRVGNMPVFSAERDGSLLTAEDVAVTRSVEAVLLAQQDAWNRGDIDAFMEGYWKDERLRFASGGNITHGWQATIDRYKARYTDRAAMGTLEFSDLDVQALTASGAAIVHGRWALARAEDRPSGLYTLVFRNFGDEGWLIVSDTTTSAD